VVKFRCELADNWAQELDKLFNKHVVFGLVPAVYLGKNRTR